MAHGKFLLDVLGRGIGAVGLGHLVAIYIGPEGVGSVKDFLGELFVIV